MNRRIVRNLGTWFGLGDMPKAPGTFGTLGGIPVFILLSLVRGFFPNNMVYNSFYFMFLMTFLEYLYMSVMCVKGRYLRKRTLKM